MELTDEFFELADRYYNGQLTKDELVAINQRIKNEADFANQIKQFVKAKEAIKTDARTLLRQQVAERVELGKKKTEGKPKPRIWVAAALILIVVGLPTTMTFFDNGGHVSTSALIKDNYEVPSISARGNETQQQWMDAAMAYDKGSYEEAIQLLTQLAQDPTTGNLSEVHLYLGVSLIETEQPLEAIGYFEKIKPDSFLYPKAQWYTAIAYLKEGDHKKAAEQLKSIANSPKHYKKEAAANILKELR